MLSGCSVTFIGNGKKVNCTAKMDYPHASSGSPGYMDAKAHATCDGAAYSTFTISLQKQNSQGVWIAVPNSSFSQTVKSTVPNMTYNIMTARGVKCVNGMYRSVVSISGHILPLGPPNSTTTYGTPVQVKC